GVDVAPGGDGGPASSVPEFWGLKEFDAFLLVSDDVPWGGAFNPALTSVSLEDVDHVEVLRGPAPVMYGATSFVGVLHIVHRPPADRTREASATLGSYGSGKGLLGVALPRWSGFDSRLTAGFERRGLGRSHGVRSLPRFVAKRTGTRERTLRIRRRRERGEPGSGQPAPARG